VRQSQVQLDSARTDPPHLGPLYSFNGLVVVARTQQPVEQPSERGLSARVDRAVLLRPFKALDRLEALLRVRLFLIRERATKQVVRRRIPRSFRDDSSCEGLRSLRLIELAIHGSQGRASNTTILRSTRSL